MVKQIEATVADNVTGIGNGVNVEAIKSLLKEMHLSFEQFAAEQFADVNDTEQEEDGSDSDSITTQNREKTVTEGVGEISSSSDVLKTFDLLCKYYAEYEPTSPVPIIATRKKASRCRFHGSSQESNA